MTPLTPDQIEVLDRLWRAMVEHPFPQMCKHVAAMLVLQTMEDLGVDTPAPLVHAIVHADDETALAFERLPVSLPDDN